MACERILLGALMCASPTLDRSAQAAGVGACFIAGGIHAQDVRLRGDPAGGNAEAVWDGEALGRLCRDHGVAPRAVMAFMHW